MRKLTGLSWAIAMTSVLTAGALVSGTSAQAGSVDLPLWMLAAKHGKFFGSATDTPSLDDAPYQRILDREFNQTTPGNTMKWYATEPQRGVFDFAPAERFMALAKGN